MTDVIHLWARQTPPTMACGQTDVAFSQFEDNVTCEACKKSPMYRNRMFERKREAHRQLMIATLRDIQRGMSLGYIKAAPFVTFHPNAESSAIMSMIDVVDDVLESAEEFDQ